MHQTRRTCLESRERLLKYIMTCQDLSGKGHKGAHVTPGHRLTDHETKKTVVAQSFGEGSGSDCEPRVFLTTQRERAEVQKWSNPHAIAISWPEPAYLLQVCEALLFPRPTSLLPTDFIHYITWTLILDLTTALFHFQNIEWTQNLKILLVVSWMSEDDSVNKAYFIRQIWWGTRGKPLKWALMRKCVSVCVLV